jgi:RecA-family ATPase
MAEASMTSPLDDLRQYCESACIKLWGEPHKRTTKELRWNGGDAYSAKTFSRSKRAWYDHGAKRGGSTLDLVDYHKGRPQRDLHGSVVFDVWREANAMGIVPDPAPEPKPNGKGGKPILAAYPYCDEHGTLLFEVVRFDTTNSDERFRQRRPDGKGNWKWDLKGVRRVLYRLPELIEGIACGHLVLDCEGESDVEAAVRLGYIATTHPGGVGKWHDEYDEVFRDADVVVVSDNDPHGKGQADAEDRAQHLSRVAKRVRKIMFEQKDLRAWIGAGHSREQLDALIEQAPDYTRQEPPQSEPAPPSLPWINMSNWDNEPVPKQEWAVLDRIPLRQCVLFSGEGAAGKSTVEQHRSVAHVLGRDWLGSMPELGPAWYIDAEEEEKVLHYRLDAILRHYGVTFADAIKGGLRIMSLAGQDALLATVNRSGKVESTPFYKQLFEAAGDIKPKSISIASCANVYAGSEIERSQVQQFVSLLTRIAIVANGSVALISHPSLTGINTDSGISGSTQWHNAVRARYYMKCPKPKPDEQPDTDLREIVFKKNQYGRVFESVPLRYSNGMFLPIAGASTLDRAATQQKADDLFLKLLGKFNARNERISSKVGAHAYAPTMFADDAEAKATGIKKDAFKTSMARLFDADKIHLEQYGTKCRDTWELVTGPKPKEDQP